MSYNKPLTNIQKAVLRGSLLGDATISLAKSGKGRMRFVHGPKQFGYLEWKYKMLQSVVLTPPVIRETPAAYGSKIGSFNTQLHYYITDLYKECYKSGSKFVNWTYLNKLNSIALAVWIMDDYYLYKNGGSLSSHSFSYQGNRIITSYLAKRYNVPEPKLSFDKRCKKHFVRLSTELARKMACEVYKIIYPIKSMRYKVEWYG